MRTDRIPLRFNSRMALMLLLTLAVLAGLASPRFVTVARIDAGGAVPSRVWHVAPPEPSISEAARLSELAARRAEVMKRIGETGMLILLSGEPRVYTNDVDYAFRQENDLYYLTGINQEGVTLVLLPGAKTRREILFMPRPIPTQETWTGHMMTAAECTARSGINEVWDKSWLQYLVPSLTQSAAPGAQGTIPPEAAERFRQLREELGPFTDALAQKKAALYLLSPQANTPSREYHQEQAFAAQMASLAPALAIKDARPIFAALRLSKSPWEQALVQYAIDIDSEAFHRVFAMAVPGVYEYQVQAEFEYTFRRRHGDYWGYPCIVGDGANATTLHYETNQDRLQPNTLLLMDCSAEYEHYSADVTRTIPVSGKFTKEQADIYRIVWEASTEATKLAVAGKQTSDVHARALEIIKDGLLRLGLIISKDSNEYRTWFMHGTSHWIGMNVHDVGGRAVLQQGMMFTVEPGIYIRPDALDVLPKNAQNEKFIAAVKPAFEKYKGIGVRIEDDVLVTEGDPKVMSAAIPSKLEDVEATIAKLRQERSRAGLP